MNNVEEWYIKLCMQEKYLKRFFISIIAMTQQKFIKYENKNKITSEYHVLLLSENMIKLLNNLYEKKKYVYL
ncbi:hypothetical protein [Bacillus cereus]|nr:hypothetical protein [Bacillus cereus]